MDTRVVARYFDYATTWILAAISVSFLAYGYTFPSERLFSLSLVIVAWVCVLSLGTRGLFSNFPDEPATRGGKVQGLLFFLAAAALCGYFVSERASSSVLALFALAQLVALFAIKAGSKKSLGYKVISPFFSAGLFLLGLDAYQGLAGSGLLPFGLVAGVALAATYLLFHYRWRKLSRFHVGDISSTLFLCVTTFALFEMIGTFPYLVYSLMALALVLAGFTTAHSRVLHGRDGFSDAYSRIRFGGLNLGLTSLLFLVGVFQTVGGNYLRVAYDALTGSGVTGSVATVQSEELVSSVLVLTLFATATVLAGRYVNSLLFILFSIVSSYGLLEVLSIRISGVWELAPLEVLVLWFSLVLLIQIRPVFSMSTLLFPIRSPVGDSSTGEGSPQAAPEPPRVGGRQRRREFQDGQLVVHNGTLRKIVRGRQDSGKWIYDLE